MWTSLASSRPKCQEMLSLLVGQLQPISVATVEPVEDSVAHCKFNDCCISGQARSHDQPSSGDALVFSSDTVNVKVVKLKGVEIFIPSVTLVAGEKVDREREREREKGREEGEGGNGRKRGREGKKRLYHICLNRSVCMLGEKEKMRRHLHLPAPYLV